MTTSSMCGALSDSGRDCPNHVNPDSPINLCDIHLRVAAQWYERSRAVERTMSECPVCGQHEVTPYADGSWCARCQWSDTGRIPPAEDRPLVARATNPNPVQVVYYIRFGARIKIGTTGNLNSRLAALPYDELLALERGGRVVELDRHTRFKDLRITGEWFRPEPPLLAHIASLNRGVANPRDLLQQWRAETRRRRAQQGLNRDAC